MGERDKEREHMIHEDANRFRERKRALIILENETEIKTRRVRG